MKKIEFKDLGGWLKTAIVLLWVLIGINAIYFIVAFILEIIAVY